MDSNQIWRRKRIFANAYELGALEVKYSVWAPDRKDEDFWSISRSITLHSKTKEYQSIQKDASKKYVKYSTKWMCDTASDYLIGQRILTDDSS